jgi:class III poly(R)-hydroxyalkanoic acid synthase PhaE subunit
MTDTAFWNNDWMETQRKYWQTWTDMGLNTMGQKNLGKSPWEGALDHWWQTLAPTAPDASKLFLDKLMEQSKQFMRMTDELYRNSGSGASTEDWLAAVQKTFSNPFVSLGTGRNEQTEAMQRMMAFWEMPFDNWQRMVSSLSLVPGDALRNMPHEQMKDNLHRVLSAPGLGYSREEQGQYQDLMRYGLQYQGALHDYMQFFSNLGVKSTERMRMRLEALNAEGPAVDSARGLYDLWVGCCEDVYAEQVMTPEYAILYGRLINSLMKFKHRMSDIVDESLGTMNMPTRAELRTLQDRLQETRRENKSLRQDVEALRELVAALDAGVTPAPAVALAAGASRQSAAAQREFTSAKPAVKGE